MDWIVRGCVAKVIFDRAGMRQDASAPNDASRVRLLRGPKEIVNFSYLTRVFSKKIPFEIDLFIVRWETERD